MASSPTIFQVITQQILPTIGWSTIVSFIGWAWIKSVRLVVMLTKQHEDGQKAIGQIDALASNHFPHIQQELTDLNSKTAEANEELKDISKGIAVLVDRGSRI